MQRYGNNFEIILKYMRLVVCLLQKRNHQFTCKNFILTLFVISINYLKKGINMKKVIDKAASRGYFNHGWLKTHHTFSFANYYNPERIHFGALRVLNDDSVDPSMGFDTHPHKNMEVISIPLKGYLRHGDSVQNTKTITPGDIQVMSTGSGIFHSEYNGMCDLRTLSAAQSETDLDEPCFQQIPQRAEQSDQNGEQHTAGAGINI